MKKARAAAGFGCSVRREQRIPGMVPKEGIEPTLCFQKRILS
jgi:hypothetical protein